MLEDLEILSNRCKDYQVFQIDAGWYRCNGDWDENEKFPHGMKYLCDKIKEKGFIPGIWVAPFDFSEESETHNKHKDWFISSPTYRDCIDFSNIEAQNYLRACENIIWVIKKLQESIIFLGIELNLGAAYTNLWYYNNERISFKLKGMSPVQYRTHSQI